MPKRVEGEEFLNTDETMEELNASKKLFYHNVRPQLHVYHFEGKRTPWYKKSDVHLLKTGRTVRKADIVLAGILGDWTTYLQSLGFRGETINRSAAIAKLPEELIDRFNLPPDEQYVKRARMTLANGAVIALWDTYYPVVLVQDILDSLLNGTARNIVEHIKEKHGLVIGMGEDWTSARLSTMEEHNAFRLVSDEAILSLQRVSYAKDGRTLILASDMALLGSWFTTKHAYDVTIWDG
ncbi:MAG TPA: UTRA domain-containing protein [Ktedonobacteraceae bacterium]|jgi:hypothetical protein